MSTTLLLAALLACLAADPATAPSGGRLHQPPASDTGTAVTPPGAEAAIGVDDPLGDGLLDTGTALTPPRALGADTVTSE